MHRGFNHVTDCVPHFINLFVLLFYIIYMSEQDMLPKTSKVKPNSGRRDIFLDRKIRVLYNNKNGHPSKTRHSIC